MSIVNSTYSVGVAQVDGRRYVDEVHTDHLGGQHLMSYLAAINADYAAIMASHVPVIESSLANDEYVTCLSTDTLTTNHITKADLVAKFRQAYRESSKEELARLATWLINRVQAGDITQAQIQAAFNLDAAQYNELRDRALALRDHWAAVQAAVGE